MCVWTVDVGGSADGERRAFVVFLLNEDHVEMRVRDQELLDETQKGRLFVGSLFDLLHSSSRSRRWGSLDSDQRRYRSARTTPPSFDPQLDAEA